MTARPNILLPPEISNAAKEKLAALQLAVAHKGLSLDTPLEDLPGVRYALGFSDFIAKTCSRNPRLLVDLVDKGDLEARYEPGEYHRRLALLESVEGDPIPTLQRQLRFFRAREMVRIAWRDLAGLAGLDHTLTDLSELADACVEYALKILYAHQCRTYGAPFSKSCIAAASAYPSISGISMSVNTTS